MSIYCRAPYKIIYSGVVRGVLASTHAVASYPGVSLVNLEPGFEASYACALWVITDSCHNPCAPINSSEEQQEHNNTAVAIII